MVWNKDLPDGSKQANLLDDDIRSNNAALETAISEEHVFSTGGDQTGKHKFAVESTATRNADTDYVDGSLSILDDSISGQYEPTFQANSTWYSFIAPFLNYQNDWVKGQLFTPTTLTSASNHIASDWRDANIFTITMTEDSTLDNPTLTGLTDKAAVRFYIITQDDPARTLSYGSLFTEDGANGSTGPALSTTVDSLNILMAVLEPDDPSDMIHITRLMGPASDTQAQAGSSDALAVTPANLGSNVTSTNTKGHLELVGTGKLLQWVQFTTSGTGVQETFSVAFNNANYTVAFSSIATVEYYFSIEIIDSQTIESHHGSASFDVHVIAIGDAT